MPRRALLLALMCCGSASAGPSLSLDSFSPGQRVEGWWSAGARRGGLGELEWEAGWYQGEVVAQRDDGSYYVKWEDDSVTTTSMIEHKFSGRLRSPAGPEVRVGEVVEGWWAGGKRKGPTDAREWQEGWYGGVVRERNSDGSYYIEWDDQSVNDFLGPMRQPEKTEQPNCASVPISPNAPDRRAVDPVATVRDEHTGENPLRVSGAEWRVRTETAALYRGLALHGMGSDLAAQCVMVRHPEHPFEFLMAEWGVFFEEVTASNLLRYDFAGNLIDPQTGNRIAAEPSRSNMGCIPVAAAIMTHRRDVSAVVHAHPPAVMAVGGLRDGLLPLSQAAFFLHGQVSREQYDFTYENSFEDTLAAGFSGGKRAMLLNHHGMYAVGRDCADAFFVAFYLNQACEVQVRTLSMAGGDLSRVILPEARKLGPQYKDMMLSTDYAYDGSREWPGLVRSVTRRDPGYNL